MGEEEIENFPLRIFIFFLKGKYIFHLLKVRFFYK